jgi:putative transposase
MGIDVGLKTFATLSAGQHVANPRFSRQEVRALAKVQRRLSTEENGPPERAKRRKVIARAHERTRWRRGDVAHQHRCRIVTTFDLIAVDDMSVKRMVRNPCLAKSIHDVAWSRFASLLSYKAAWVDRKYVAVNPHSCRQDCSSCGHRQTRFLADRLYACPCCGIIIDRDYNAAKNILALRQQCLASP